MSVTFVKPDVSCEVVGYQTNVPVAGGFVTLDSLNIPYASAEVESGLADLDLEDLDPRLDVRVKVTARDLVAGTSRVFDLGVRQRTIDHDTRRVSLTLASDEELLKDYISMTTDSIPRTHEGSLYGVVNYVLGKAITLRRNMMRNPWVMYPAPAGSIYQNGEVTLSGAGGGGRVRVTHNAGATPGGDYIALYAGDLAPGTYGFRLMLSEITGSLTVGTLFRDGGGVPLGTITQSRNGSILTLTGTVTVPTAIPTGQAHILVDILGPGTGEAFTLEQSILEPGVNVAGPYFDGGSVPPATRYDGAAFNSPSRWVAQLAPAGGAPDVAVPAYWSLTNYMPSASGEVTTGWIPANNVGNIGLDTTSGAAYGAAFVYWRAVNAGASVISSPAIATAKAGDVFTASAAFMIEDPGPRECFMILHYHDLNGVLIGQTDGPHIVVTRPPTWPTAYVTGTAPPGTVKVSVLTATICTAPSQASGVDGILLVEGAEAVPPFSGNGGNGPLASGYTYKWLGPPEASPSMRTPKLPREPELYVWKPGVSAWDFLAPLVSSEGLRLYCDENRVWRLIDPSTFVVPGRVTMSAFNIERGADTTSRDDPDIFATGVVVVYTWRDALDVVQVAYDVAGTPGRGAVVHYERPYPGPGAAASILARRSGSGRTQDVVAIVDWKVIPGMEASVTLPDSPNQQGKVNSVRFPLDDEPLMEVGTRGLIDIPPGSWAAGKQTVTWNSVTGTWTTFTWGAQP